jgi:hypothetical protein
MALVGIRNLSVKKKKLALQLMGGGSEVLFVFGAVLDTHRKSSLHWEGQSRQVSGFNIRLNKLKRELLHQH